LQYFEIAPRRCFSASLLMGLALRNLPHPLNVAYYIDHDISSHLRELALTIILTRAGLEIDPKVSVFDRHL